MIDLVPGQAAAVDTFHAPPQVNQSASSQPRLPVLRRSPGTAPENVNPGYLYALQTVDLPVINCIVILLII